MSPLFASLGIRRGDPEDQQICSPCSLAWFQAILADMLVVLASPIHNVGCTCAKYGSLAASRHRRNRIMTTKGPSPSLFGPRSMSWPISSLSTCPHCFSHALRGQAMAKLPIMALTLLCPFVVPASIISQHPAPSPPFSADSTVLQLRLSLPALFHAVIGFHVFVQATKPISTTSVLPLPCTGQTCRFTAGDTGSFSNS